MPSNQSREDLSPLQRAVFQANGYPTQVNDDSLRKHPKPPLLEAQDQPTLHLTYVKGVSERIERACRHLGIKTNFKSRGTFHEALVHTKQPQPALKKNGVVYQVPCAVCNCVYIGETGRTLEKRLSEHREAVTQRMAWQYTHGRRSTGWTGKLPQSSRLK